jgi:UDP-3-O-[3-hydroxymyristoyl] glucosamine N-acyltransferase
VGHGTQVGDDSWLMPGVVVQAECTIGKRVRLHPGVIIGSDGFGYEFVEGRHAKVPQVGTVVIGDDVEIGANTTVDRSRFERTSVGEGTKIDNLVQVGHNVVIGKHCMICALVGIAGSVTLGDYVVVGGQCGLAGHLTVGSGAMIAAKSGVKDDIPPKTSVWGSPSLPLLLEQKIIILRNRLPDLFKRVDALEKQAAAAKG